MTELKDKLPTAKVEIPVFMLPRNDLATIPEDEEIHEGFFLQLLPSLLPPPPPPHRLWFLGLMAMDDGFFSDTTSDIHYRKFSYRIDKDMETKKRRSILSRSRRAIRHQSFLLASTR